MALQHRNLEPTNVDIIVGIDGGQVSLPLISFMIRFKFMPFKGMLKVTCQITEKPTINEIGPSSSKRIRFEEGYGRDDFRDSSVHKVLLLAIATDLQENHHNLNIIISKLKLNSLVYSLSEDIKVMLQMVGKQSASCKHPCPYCEAESPLQFGVHFNANTLGSLDENHKSWEKAGANPLQAKQFQNVTKPSLLTGSLETKVIEKLNIPGLHIILGVTDKLLKEMEINLFKTKEDGFRWLSDYLKTINLKRVCYQGQHRLEGNNCMHFLKKVDNLQRAFESDPDLTLPGLKYVKVFRSFYAVIESCFGKTLDLDYRLKIEAFCKDYEDIGASVTLKVHILEIHVPEFIQMKGESFGKSFN